MSRSDRLRWEARHSENRTPNPPPESLSRLPAALHDSALALDVACGTGRNALVVANLGYQVVALDVAWAAVQRLPGDARLLPVQADLDAWPFAADAFDLVLQINFLDRTRIPDLLRSVKPGGHILIDTFLDAGHPNETGPSSPAFRLRPGELATWASQWDVLLCEESDGPTARGVLLARRPLPHRRTR
jgi:tellurite methyltransferase